MTFNLKKINELTSQWQFLTAPSTDAVLTQPSVEDLETPSEKFLREVTELNRKTQSVLDNIPFAPPSGFRQQKESKNWHSSLINLSTASLRSVSLLESLAISQETEPLANQVLADCLATSTTTRALAKAFRFLISSSYEPEVVQMIAQVFGNHDAAPNHEIEKVPKTSVKKVLAELYGDEIVKNIFKLYNLSKAPDINGDDLRALLVGILANLDETALKHIVTHKERHKQITAFAFFDQFLTHSNSTTEKRFSELDDDELTAFLNCVRKSLLDVDTDALLASKADYRQQLLRDLNLLCYCSQATLNPHFSIGLNSILQTFTKEGQIKETLIPLSNQSLMPLSQILEVAPNEEAHFSSSSEPSSFFPEETLSCYLNDASLHRINAKTVLENPEQESSVLPSFTSSRVAPTSTYEPFEFLQRRHPLVDIAGMIEKMRSGKLTIVGAQRIRIELDPATKELFNPHESALFENPGSFFYLYDLVERMDAQLILCNKEAVLEAFRTLADPLRNSIARKIYQLSDNPTKKTVKNWGEIHAADNLQLLLKAITLIKNNIFDFSYKKIEDHTTSILSSLSQEKAIEVHYEIYRIAKPETSDPHWGEKNVASKLSRLVAALHLRGVLPGPQLASYPERVEAPHTLSLVPLAPDPITSSAPLAIAVQSLPIPPTDQLSELPKPKAVSPKQHPLVALASMIESFRSGSLSFVEAQNVVVRLDSELEQLFAKHERALIADPSTYFHLAELVRQMASGSITTNKETILEAFQKTSIPLRNSLAKKIYELSEAPDKGNVSNWGEVHAVDDLSCLKLAIDSLTDNIFNTIYSKITLFATSKLATLEKKQLSQLYFEIHRIAKPNTENPNWAEENALAVTSRLIEALHCTGVIHIPESVDHQDIGLSAHMDFHPPFISLTPSRGASSSNSERNIKAHGNHPTSPSSPFIKGTPINTFQSPSKSSDNVGSFQKSFAISSPFSPNKGTQGIPSASVVRVLFPPTSNKPPLQSAPNRLPGIPLPPVFTPLPPPSSIKANPEELHKRNELNRLKRESEARVKFSEMYTTVPLSSSDLEKVFRLEGNISSCRTTINLLQKQGEETGFSDSIVKALLSSIQANETEIKKIKNSAPITFEDFTLFKNHINKFTTNEIKLILYHVSFDLQELPAMAEMMDDLIAFSCQYSNEELKKIASDNSELYKKLFVEGANRYVSHLLATVKVRSTNPALEPVHEIRPFRRKNREALEQASSDTSQKQVSARLDMSEIANFHFKPRPKPPVERPTDRASVSSTMPIFPQLKSITRHHLPRDLDLTASPLNTIELQKQERLALRQKRIEEAQQTKIEHMKLDFIREKLVVFAKEILKPDLHSEETRRDLDDQLRLLPSTSDNQSKREDLTRQLQSIDLKIEEKKEEAENARDFIINSNTWTPEIIHRFVTTERLEKARAYAEKQLKVQGWL